MRFFTAFLIVLLCSCLAGCLVDDLKEQNSPEEKPNPEDEHYFSVSGRVVKGVFDGATVRIYPIINGRRAPDPVAESITNDHGFYQIKIPRQYLGKSALISASAADARMKCDFTKGCHQQSFGDWMVMGDEELVIDVGVPELRESGIYNGSVLTHLGFALAENRLISEGAAGNGVVDLVTRLVISKANSEVASAFGVIGDLPSIDIVDVTDEDEIASAKSATLHYSMINSAVVMAAIGVYHEPDFTQALFRLTGQFVASGIPGNSSLKAGEVTQDALLETLAEAYRHLEDLGAGRHDEAQSEILALHGLYLSEPAQEYGRGISSNSTHLTFVEKAKLIVRGIREVALSMDLRKLADFNNLSGILSGEASGTLAAFGAVVDTSVVLKEENVDKIQAALVSVSQAIFDTLLLYYQTQPIPSTVRGIKITHYPLARSHRFVIRDEVNTCDTVNVIAGSCAVPVDLDIFLEFRSFGGNVSEQLIRLDDLKLTVVGSLGDSDYKLIFTGMEPQLTARMLFLEDESGQNNNRVFLEMQDWQLSAPVSVIALEQNLYSELNGSINSSGEELVVRIESKDLVVWESDSGVELSSTSTYELSHLRRFNLNAALSVDASKGDRFSASINLVQGITPFEGAAVYKTQYRKICSAEKTGCLELDEQSGIEGETADKFVQLSASVAYKASLKAIEGPVLIQMTGSRESPAANNISSLKLSYPGHALALNGRFNNSGGIIALDAVNLDGMRLNFDTINGKRTGKVQTPTQESVAEIIDMGQWVKVRYKDGTFESLL